MLRSLNMTLVNGDHRAGSDGARSFDPAREHVAVYGHDRQSIQIAVGLPAVKATASKLSWKGSDVSHYKHDFINSARSEGVD